MSKPLGLRQATLSLRTYDPRWVDLYEAEAALIRDALPAVAFEIAHIGSTAVPGLQAKPILDIAMRSAAETQVATALVGLGYVDRGIRSGRLFIRLRDGDIRTHNLHLYLPDDPDWQDQMAFRDALRAEPELGQQYEALKRELVERFGDEGRSQYTDGKTAFVRAVVDRQLGS